MKFHELEDENGWSQRVWREARGKKAGQTYANSLIEVGKPRGGTAATRPGEAAAGV